MCIYLRMKKYLQEKMSDFVYNGFWFSPEATYTRKCLELSQQGVSGKVTVQIYKGNGKLNYVQRLTYYSYAYVENCTYQFIFQFQYYPGKVLLVYIIRTWYQWMLLEDFRLKIALDLLTSMQSDLRSMLDLLHKQNFNF